VLGVTTIRRAELRDGATKLTAANDLAIRRALEAAGVEFIDESESGGPGVRLRKPQRDRAKKNSAAPERGQPTPTAPSRRIARDKMAGVEPRVNEC
jgi:hypothetical protein